MQHKSSAEQIRDLVNRLERLNEYDTHSETGQPDHNISSMELMRLKSALKPLVDEPMQGRFMQILNKMNTGQPITTVENKLLTSAFIAMADIIADDPGLITRVRKDIIDFNDEHEDTLDADEEESDQNADEVEDETDSEEMHNITSDEVNLPTKEREYK